MGVPASKQASDPFLQEKGFTEKTLQEHTEFGWESQLDAHSSVLWVNLPSPSLSAPIYPLWGLDHVLCHSQGICEPQVLKMESGVWGFLRPFQKLHMIKTIFTITIRP